MPLGNRRARVDEWGTPPEVFRPLDQEFRFALDVAASRDLHVCPRYLTKRNNALRRGWGPRGSSAFCNPPYGPPIALFVAKAAREARRGVTCVVLVPARTDTRWFHDVALRYAEIRFLRGRVRFLESARVRGHERCPHPTMVLVFRPRDSGRCVPALTR